MCVCEFEKGPSLIDKTRDDLGVTDSVRELIFIDILFPYLLTHLYKLSIHTSMMIIHLSSRTKPSTFLLILSQDFSPPVSLVPVSSGPLTK